MIWGFPAAALGLLLVVAGQVRDRRGARLCGATLLAFALWDFSAVSWRSSTGDAAIRIDLVFLLPIALAAAAGGILNLMSRPLPPEAAADPPPEDTPDR
jgi:zinc transporter ZupT